MHAKRRLATCLDRIERLDGDLRAFITVTGRSARKQAAAIGSADRDRPLAGAIVAVKDCIDTAGIRTTHGSPIFADRIPAADATIVARLKRAGAILIGKTNLHELAMGATTQNATFGSCRNPWDLSRIPGGSSGGSAVAVAAGMCDIALGTDTGGSIRNPATFTGIVGLRPTIGRIPLRGVLRVSPTIDTAGPMARSVREAAQAYAVLANDPAALPAEAAAPGDLVRGLRLELGLHKSAGEYRRAMRLVARWRAAVERAFASFDALIGPATAFSAPKIDELGSLTGVSTRINHLNIPWSGAGTPVLALPAGFDRARLPIGIQLVAPWWREASLLALGAWYQTVTDWHRAVPPAVRFGKR